jgi:pre-rRNA-processing protein TSR3
MQSYLPTVIIRHTRENLKKCSLKGLENRSDFIFHTYPLNNFLTLQNYIYLCVDAPPLSKEDFSYGLLVIDATWRLAGKMEKVLNPMIQTMIPRSIPGNIRTAYPRYQDDCIDPERGLASIEAIFSAYELMGRPTDGLLDGYYWKEKFLNLKD